MLVPPVTQRFDPGRAELSSRTEPGGPSELVSCRFLKPFFVGRIWSAPGLNKVIAFHSSQDVPYILRPFRLFRGLAVWLRPLSENPAQNRAPIHPLEAIRKFLDCLGLSPRASADRTCYAGGLRRARIFLSRRRHIQPCRERSARIPHRFASLGVKWRLPTRGGRRSGRRTTLKLPGGKKTLGASASATKPKR